MNSNSATKLAPLFVVDTPPYAHIGRTIHSMSRDTLFALLPAALFSIMSFGLLSLRVMALAMATAVLTEALCLYLAGRDNRIHDGTALVSGLLLAFLLPAGAPWWLVVIGSSLSICLGKQVFGGLGANPLCVPLIGWAILTISWPTYMDPSSMLLSSNLIDPLLRLKYFGVNSLADGSYQSLLLGEQLGGLGSAFVGAITIGGIYLVARKAVRLEIVLSYLLGVLITALIYWKIDPGSYLSPELYFLTGSTMFAAFFLATDHASSPVDTVGIIIFGLFAGAMTVLIRIYGIYLDGAIFAILLANLLTPILDLIRPAPWGKRSQSCGK